MDKTVEELTMFSSIKQLIRFLKEMFCGKASRKIYKLLKLIPWSEVYHGGRPLKSYDSLKQNSPKEMKKTAQDLVVFV